MDWWTSSKGRLIQSQPTSLKANQEIPLGEQIFPYKQDAQQDDKFIEINPVIPYFIIHYSRIF